MQVLFTFTPLAATAGPLVAGAINDPLHTFALMAAAHLLNIAYIAGWLDAVAPEEVTQINSFLIICNSLEFLIF